MAHLEVYLAAEPRSTVYLDDAPADGVGFADYIMGRSPEVWLTLAKDQNVSRLHAKLSPIGARWAIEDLGARNGTWVNGDRIVGMHVLRDGDEIRMGATCVVFRDQRLVHESTTVKPGLRPDITPKEREALVALCRPFFAANLVKKAASRKEMAGEMYVGQAAVQMHLTNLYRKFLIPDDATDRARPARDRGDRGRHRRARRLRRRRARERHRLTASEQARVLPDSCGRRRGAGAAAEGPAMSSFAPIAPTIHVPPTEIAPRHLRDPPGAGGARPAAVRLHQLDGDPRRGAGDRRHRHAREPQAVARGRVLARRARRTCAGSSSPTTTSTTAATSTR